MVAEVARKKPPRSHGRQLDVRSVTDTEHERQVLRQTFSPFNLRHYEDVRSDLTQSRNANVVALHRFYLNGGELDGLVLHAPRCRFLACSNARYSGRYVLMAETHPLQSNPGASPGRLKRFKYRSNRTADSETPDPPCDVVIDSSMVSGFPTAPRPHLTGCSSHRPSHLRRANNRISTHFITDPPAYSTRYTISSLSFEQRIH